MWKQHLVQLFCAAFQACCTGVHYSCDPELSSFYAHIYGHCDQFYYSCDKSIMGFVSSRCVNKT